MFWGFGSGLSGPLAGAVDIKVEPSGACGGAPCSWVWLNADQHRLNITGAKSSHSGSIGDLEVTAHPTLSIVGLRVPASQLIALGDKLGDGITLHIQFNSTIGPGLDGVYVSEWASPGGPVPIVATQFEATAARKAVPCFDEPSFKAPFTVTVGCEDCQSDTVLGNMPRIENPTSIYYRWSGISMPWASATTEAIAQYLGPRDFEKVKMTYFPATTPMSSYLLALTIGPLEYTEATFGAANTVSRVWTTPGQAARGTAALEMSVKMLEFYEAFFGSDMVAVPDFAAGAMENWGLVLYRETALLHCCTACRL